MGRRKIIETDHQIKNRKRLAITFRVLRSCFGLTLKQTADMTGLSFSAIAKFEKGDLKTNEIEHISFVVECKCTQNVSYSITEKVWNEVKEHSNNRSWTSRPALCIRLYGKTEEETSWGGTRTNTPEELPVELDLVVLDLNDFLEFYEQYLELKSKQEKEF